ncbi:MAG TPA: cyclic nucleotide-binding domain-containing protein [Candidatus Hydrogenedentes bacterium]|nr:cyclic nucleotide-binding domain-containing protein [Candidatus Hydrogenedentota bacterium]HIJ73978.1 cyclic nucleotide-binding domain-containing protein [Candidatus Hydrogenedentota bacterium]
MVSERQMGMLVRLAAQVEFFHGLEPHEVAKIFSKGMTQRITKGETIFLKGTTGNTMYVVLGGKVGIFDGRKQIAELKQGAMFGEMALTTHEPRSASAVALEDSHLFALNETTFERLLTKRAAVRILLNIIHTLSRRLKEANAKLKEIG